MTAQVRRLFLYQKNRLAGGLAQKIIPNLGLDQDAFFLEGADSLRADF